MRALVTGSSGGVGEAVVEALERAGHDVVPFDVKAGDDILDLASVTQAATGADTVVHLAAILDESRPADRIMSVNLVGSYNVLSAAQQAGVGRVVLMSSIQAFGVVQSYRDTDYRAHVGRAPHESLVD